MKKAEINTRIAKALGFERGTTRVNGRPYKHWVYPDEWAHWRTSAPERALPDFVAILEEATQFAASMARKKDYDTSVQKTTEATP